MKLKEKKLLEMTIVCIKCMEAKLDIIYNYGSLTMCRDPVVDHETIDQIFKSVQLIILAGII